MLKTPTIQELMDRIDELEMILGLNRTLTEEIMDTFGLAREEARFLGPIFKRGEISYESLHAAMYGNRPECDQPSFEILKGYACRVRQRLAEYRIGFRTRTRWGFVMPAEDQKLMQEMLDA